MDKYEAQYAFWASFGVPAYEENSVPDRNDVSFPYITYQAVSSTFEENANVNANIWTRSTSWLGADTLSNAIETALADGGQILHYDGGILWITPSSPFAQNLGDPDDSAIKRKLLNVQLHFN